MSAQPDYSQREYERQRDRRSRCARWLSSDCHGVLVNCTCIAAPAVASVPWQAKMDWSL